MVSYKFIEIRKKRNLIIKQNIDNKYPFTLRFTSK